MVQVQGGPALHFARVARFILRRVTWENVLSGLVGAVLGLGGAFIIDWLGVMRARGAAARTVFMEVAVDNAALAFMEAHGVYVPLASSTWAVQQPLLARALSESDFVTVATYYMRVALIVGRRFPPAGAPIPALQAAATEALQRGESAADILERRGWVAMATKGASKAARGPTSTPSVMGQPCRH
jgi:hypothetical protein